MSEFLKNNGFNLANGLTLVVIIASVALLFGTLTANVKNLQEDMLTKESEKVAETRDESIIREIGILRESIQKDFSRLESKIDGISLKLLQ